MEAEARLNTQRFSEAGEDEKPYHKVEITEPFYLSTFEVTKEQFTVITGAATQGNQHLVQGPAVKVSWEEAMMFCAKLESSMQNCLSLLPSSDSRGVNLTWHVTLPTEAQWEYAAKAGNENAFILGASVSDLDEIAWYDGNSNAMLHEVGEKLPNAYGLFDILGNASEWCLDWYGADYYQGSPRCNPNGPKSGEFKVIRGGSFARDPSTSRVTQRMQHKPNQHSNRVGFRVGIAATREVAATQGMTTRSSEATQGLITKDRDENDEEQPQQSEDPKRP